SLFRREGRNTIDWVSACADCTLQATNTSIVNFNGGEASVKYHLGRWSVDLFEVGYSYLTTDKESVAYQSFYVFDYLKNKLTLKVRHTLLKGLLWTYSLSFQDRNGHYKDSNDGLDKDYPH